MVPPDHDTAVSDRHQQQFERVCSVVRASILRCRILIALDFLKLSSVNARISNNYQCKLLQRISEGRWLKDAHPWCWFLRQKDEWRSYFIPTGCFASGDIFLDNDSKFGRCGFPDHDRACRPKDVFDSALDVTPHRSIKWAFQNSHTFSGDSRK